MRTDEDCGYLQNMSDDYSSGSASEIEGLDHKGEEAYKKNKEKNKEHAKKTRVRRKAFIETLQMSMKSLCEQAENDELELLSKLNEAAYVMEKRKFAMQQYFWYFSTYETDRAKWGAVVSESCWITSPLTSYQPFNPLQVSGGMKYMVGMDAIIADCASLHMAMQSLTATNKKICFRYHCDPSDMICHENYMMAPWSMRTLNCITLGAGFECFKRGMLTATFDDNHLISSVELVFDSMCFLQQLCQSSPNKHVQLYSISPGQTGFEGKLRSHEAGVLLSPTLPYIVHKASQRWQFGDATVGRPLAMLQWAEGNESLKGLLDALERNMCFSGVFLDHFTTTSAALRMYPTYTSSGEVEYFVLITGGL